jgi:hypothetical protein
MRTNSEVEAKQPGPNAALVPVTMRALIQRINRKLNGELQRLHVCRRNSRFWTDLGDFYIVDTNRNHIMYTCVDPVTYGRSLGVLNAYERVVEE